MIEKERIEALKDRIDLKAYIESRGISLRKRGKEYVGLCPFHDEKKPSFHVSPEKKIFHCFGCGMAGDVFKVVKELDHVDFTEAFIRLEKENSPLVSKNSVRAEETVLIKQDSLPEAKVQQLFERVVTIYEKNFSNNDKGIKYLEKRGITDASLLSHYRIGYCDGMLATILPKDGEVREQLRSIGILLDDAIERFTGCIVFPVYDIEGNITTLYGRTITEGPKRHLFLPDRPKGVWNIGIIKTSHEIILVESIVDGISVIISGSPHVVSLQGKEGPSEDYIGLFKEYGVQKLVFMLDGDKAGRKAGVRLKERITGFSYKITQLPDNHDPNSFLVEYGVQKLSDFIHKDHAQRKEKPLSPGAQTKDGYGVQILPDGFVINYNSRRYQVLGLEKGPRKLKATVRVEYGGKLHVDTLDFYSARARRTLAQDICRIFNEIPATIDADITRLMMDCEKISNEQEKTHDTDPKSDVPRMTDNERSEAEEFGRSPDMMTRILADAEKCGLIGEEANKALGYIAMTSRMREKPLAILIISSYGAGKSLVQDTIVDFCPPEDLCKVTNLSGKALFYKERSSLSHKVLAIEEGYGAEEAFYAIRNLISTGVLVTETTIKDPVTGRLATMENRVEGPTAVFYTTTNPDGDPETKSRFFITSIDESRDQTRRIQEYQRKKHMQEDMSEKIQIERIKKKHWNFQRLLKPVEVKDPYGDRLTYGDDRLQGRRDQMKYLALIEDVAFLRQMQKSLQCEYRGGKKYEFIEVDLEDIQIANGLTHEILGRSLDELTSPTRNLLMLLDEMVEHLWEKFQKHNKDYTLQRTDIAFTRRDIRESTGWSNPRVHRYLKELVDMEYVLVECGRNGSQYRYRLAYEGQGKNGEKFVLGLVPVDKLKE